jgi:DUF4097 and DUF4098 domain-containing protein YvlB
MRHGLMLISFLAVAGFQPLGSSQQIPSQAGVPYVEREEKQFNFYPGGKLQVTAGMPGSLRIVGWQRASIRLEAEKIVHNLPPESAKALIGQYPIKVQWNQTSATIRSIGPPPNAATMEANITLYVPAEKTDITANVSKGDLAIDGLNGWVEATLGEGSLEAKSLSGYFSANTQHGDIYVELSGNRWKGLEFAASTQRGSVDLKIPAEYSADLKLETRKGKLTADYPPRLVDGESVPFQIRGRKNAQSLVAAVGEGGAPIKLFTADGDVRLSKK